MPNMFRETRDRPQRLRNDWRNYDWAADPAPFPRFSPRYGRCFSAFCSAVYSSWLLLLRRSTRLEKEGSNRTTRMKKRERGWLWKFHPQRGIHSYIYHLPPLWLIKSPKPTYKWNQSPITLKPKRYSPLNMRLRQSNTCKTRAGK